MTVLQGLVEQVETAQARSFATVAASATDTVVYVAEVEPFLTDSGTVDVDIAGVVYEATPDFDTDSLTLSPALAADVAEGDPITVTPEAFTKWAYVSFPEADEWLPCKVPHNFVAYDALADGGYDGDDRPSVEIETDPEPTVLDLLNQPPIHNATAVPVVVASEAGESMRLDGDAFTATTDDVISVWSKAGTFTDMTAADGYLYANEFIGAGSIRKFDATTGTEVLTGFPIVGGFLGTSAGDGCLYAIYAPTRDIRKFDAATGVEVLTGFPIVGSFNFVAYDAGYLYATEIGIGDIRKFDAATGAEVLTGFPIVGTYDYVTADAGYVWAGSAAVDLFYKFDATTGVEDTNGFPVAGDFAGLVATGGYVYARDNGAVGGNIHKFDATTGVEDTTGFPIVMSGSGTTNFLAAADGYWYAEDSSSDIQAFRDGGRTVSIYANTGTAEFGALNVARDSKLQGVTRADKLSVFSTKAARTAALNIATATTTTVAFDTFTGSAKTGPFWTWDATNNRFQIAQSGVYNISADISWPGNATGYRILRIVVNGAVVAANANNAIAIGFHLNAAAPSIVLAAGDLVRVDVFQTSGGNLNIASAASTWLTIERRGVIAA